MKRRASNNTYYQDEIRNHHVITFSAVPILTIQNDAYSSLKDIIWLTLPQAKSSR
jgi:hypothetical protein